MPKKYIVILLPILWTNSIDETVENEVSKAREQTVFQTGSHCVNLAGVEFTM